MSEANTPQLILDYVIANATKGDVTSVTDTIDYCCYNVTKGSLNIGDTKGQFLSQIVKECKPKIALELGAYAGYSALRIARSMPKYGKLYTIEVNEGYAEVTRKMAAFAGVDDVVTVLTGSSGEVLRSMSVTGFDFVFLDHWKNMYKPDLLLLEELELVRSGSVIAADNIVYPGCPDFLQYVRGSPKYECTTYMATLGYKTDEDGIEKAVYVA